MSLKSLLYIQPLNSYCAQIIIYEDMNSKTFYQNVGILRASWYNENKQLTVFNYGTAFAISEQILVTCTHNIYF